MNIIIKNREEIEKIREGGKRLATILAQVAEMVRPGISTMELDEYAEKLIRDGGDEPAFLNYGAEKGQKGFPASLCTSVNNEVVHGIPKRDRILKEGDIISLDLGVKHEGLFTDHAVTVPVGKISKVDQKLIDITSQALEIGINEARPGNTVGDIGHAIEKFIGKKYGIVRTYAGHGVGKYVHEDPHIPNFGKKGTGAKLVQGMIIAIEPMVNIGGDDVITNSDGSVKTADNSRSAHFEHTILITDGDPEVITKN